jgi:putrescine transport system permease protein
VVFSRVRLGLNPEMNALATLFISAVTIGVIVANQVMMARERKRARDMRMALEPVAPKSVAMGASFAARRTEPSRHPVQG